MNDIYMLSSFLLIPAVILVFVAQAMVKSNFSKYSQVKSLKGLSGKEVSELLLSRAGISGVNVEAISGHLSDHYDPRSQTVRLSESVYSDRSLSAISVAAHETGHAIQHSTGYFPLQFRTGFFPIANIGSQAAIPLLLIGFFIESSSTILGLTLIKLAIILYGAYVLFQLVTLPVEFNASKRALAMMTENNILGATEISGAKKVLNAAALTYVASASIALLQFIRILASSRRRR